MPGGYGCPSSISAAARTKLGLMAAPPTSSGYSFPRRKSSCAQSGICLEVETSSAERPMASAPTSSAFSMMVFTGTCFPRSNTIIEKAEEVGADAIGLSALLVSTSKQMPLCAQELFRREQRYPLLVGGAA